MEKSRGTYYRDLDIPLSVFRKALKGEFKELLISGVYDETEAKDAWMEVYDLYNSSIKSRTNNVAFEIRKRIQIDYNKYEIIRRCLWMIEQVYYINILNELGIDKNYKPIDIAPYVELINKYGFKFNKDNIVKEIERVSKASRVYESKIQSRMKELEKIENAGGDWTFDDTIFIAQKHQGFAFSKDAKLIELVTCLNDLIRNKDGQKH